MGIVLVLAAGTLQIPAIKTAKRLGHRVIAVDGDPRAEGLNYADKSVVVDIKNPDECLRVAKEEKVDGALTICTEVPLEGLALINQARNLSGIRLDQVKRATDKALMHEAFKEKSIPSPRSFRCHTIEDALKAVENIEGDIIIKPAVGMGSRGITHLTSRNRLEEGYRRAKSLSSNGAVLVEEFVDGVEISVETLSWNNHTEVIAITDKITSQSPYWVEMGHTQPTILSEEIQSEVKAVTIAGIDALGLDWCAGHTEIKLSAEGPKIIEIGARLGGDFITTELTPRSSGVDIVACVVQLALGEKPEITRFEKPKGVAIRYIAPSPGKLVQIDNLEEARSVSGVTDLEIKYRIGDEIPEVQSSLDRTGWIIAEAETAQQAVESCEEGLKKVRIITRQDRNKPEN